MLLLFGSIWLFPLITALVAGDIIASEDHNGTLKTILTRSLDRGQIFAGKTLAAGHLRDRRDPAQRHRGDRRRAASSPASTRSRRLSGTRVSAPAALELVSRACSST